MDKNIRLVGSDGQALNVSPLGFFKIPDLEKEYIMYSIVDENPNNDMGGVMLGEVIRNEDNTIQVLGILPSEKDIVIAYYNEISNQLGGE